MGVLYNSFTFRKNLRIEKCIKLKRTGYMNGSCFFSSVQKSPYEKQHTASFQQVYCYMLPKFAGNIALFWNNDNLHDKAGVEFRILPISPVGVELLRFSDNNNADNKVDAVEQISQPVSAAENSVKKKLESSIQQITKESSEENLSRTEKLKKQIRDAGVAGVISYGAWEIAFWTISVPVCIAGFKGVTGHWPDFSNQEDLQKLGAEAFAFVNFARFAVPLRIGLALGTTPWVQTNIVNRFLKKEKEEDDETDEIKKD